MKNGNGITVRLRPVPDTGIREYTNTHVPKHPAFKGELQSCLVSVTPGQLFEVRVDFSKDFKIHGGGGVMVIVACGHGEQSAGGFEHTQAHWLGANQLKSSPFAFSSCRSWPKNQAEPLDTKLTVPQISVAATPTSEKTSWQTTCTAPEGSITVFIQRGHLCMADAAIGPFLQGKPVSVWARDQRVLLLRRSAANPPNTHRGLEPYAIPMFVPQKWFVELQGENGHPYAFEFRNTDVDNVTLGRPQLLDDARTQNVDDSRLNAGLARSASEDGRREHDAELNDDPTLGFARSLGRERSSLPTGAKLRQTTLSTRFPPRTDQRPPPPQANLLQLCLPFAPAPPKPPKSLVEQSRSGKKPSLDKPTKLQRLLPSNRSASAPLYRKQMLAEPSCCDQDDEESLPVKREVTVKQEPTPPSPSYSSIGRGAGRLGIPVRASSVVEAQQPDGIELAEGEHTAHVPVMQRASGSPGLQRIGKRRFVDSGVDEEDGEDIKLKLKEFRLELKLKEVRFEMKLHACKKQRIAHSTVQT